MAASFTILGSGSSGGVPRPALGWGACDPNNPRNRRRRTSLLVERRNGAGVTRVLVDTSPDLREQLLDADVNWLDAVLFTHEHADHTHGIDDLRGLFIKHRKRVDVYLDEPGQTTFILDQRGRQQALAHATGVSSDRPLRVPEGATRRFALVFPLSPDVQSFEYNSTLLLRYPDGTSGRIQLKSKKGIQMSELR